MSINVIHTSVVLGVVEASPSSLACISTCHKLYPLGGSRSRGYINENEQSQNESNFD